MASSSTPAPKLTSYAQRNLATTSSITPSSYCPTRDLVALLASSSTATITATSTSSSSSSSSPPSHAKVTLYRTTGNADLVWEYTPAAPPSTAPAPVSKFAGFGKGKAKASQVVVTATAWNPNGTHLALTTSTSVTTPSALEIIPLSSATPTPALPSINLPSCSGKVTHLSWQPLSSSSSSETQIQSSAQALIDKLPALPTISKESLRLAGIVAGPEGGPAGGGGGGARAAIFGAKNAMLQREREKEMGRPLSLHVSARGFPTLLERPERTDEGETKNEGSLLLVGDDQGQVHLYQGGSIYLGSVHVDQGAQVKGISVLPSSSSSTNISVLLLTDDSTLVHRTLRLDLPPTLDALLQQSTQLRGMLSHAFEALQDVRNLWDEARRIGKGWLSRVAEVTQNHGLDSTPISQLLMLLLTGRPSPAMHHFLASKMNEKSLSKWEGSMAQVLDRLKNVTFMSVQPAIERTILLLEEVRAWAQWSENFAEFELPIESISKPIVVAQEIIRASTRLERIVLEEEKCFHSFAAWLHYELEKVAHQEGSEIRPTANFSPIPVAHYIRHCLPVDVNSIRPFLNFGPFAASLEANADLARAKRWVDGLDVTEPAVGEDEEDEERLVTVLRRMKEELKGQVAAERFAAQRSDAPSSSGGERFERPPKSSDSTMQDAIKDEAPVSLPIMLHLLAERVGEILEQAIRKVGQPKLDFEEPNVVLGSMEDGTLLRERVVGGGLMRAWTSEGALRVARTDFTTPMDRVHFIAAAKLETEKGLPIEVVDFGWLDDEELLLVGKVQDKKIASFSLLGVELASLQFQLLTPHSTSHPLSTRLPICRELAFEPQFPPEGLALHCRPDRRVACVLAGEGRRMDVVGVDAEPEGVESDRMRE